MLTSSRNGARMAVKLEGRSLATVGPAAGRSVAGPGNQDEKLSAYAV